MVDNKENKHEEMIARANLAVQEASGEFVGNLKKRVSDLEAAIRKNDRKQITEIAYNLETEAATFGWPHVTRVCKWLRKVFLGDYDQAPEAEDVLMALNVLKQMVNDPENRDDDRDEQLFKDIYPAMKKVISDS